MAKSTIRKIIETYAAKRLFGYGPADDYSYVDQFQGPSKDLKLLGMYSGVAYRCINTLSEAIAGQYVPYPYTMNSSGKQVTVNDHPFWTVLNNPNPDMTYYQLLEGSASFVEQFGEFFWYLVPGKVSGSVADPKNPGSGIKQIFLLRPDKVGIQLDKVTGEVIGYKYQTGAAGQTIPFTTDEIMHFMTFNPKNPYRGYSTVEAAIEYIATEEEVSRFTRNYFKNNAAMSGVLSVEGKLTRENWNKFVRQWRERYQGVDNAGKVALVRDSQITFTPVTSNISDMQLNDLKETTVDQILMMFRIPKGLFGMESDQGLGRASVETLEYIFAKWTIDNKLDRFDDFIEQITKQYYPGTPVMVGHNNIIPDDKEYLLNYYNQGVDRWVTRQEIREKDPDLANTKIPGSGQLFTTIQQMPLEDPDAEPEVPPTPPPKPAPKPPEDDDDSSSDDNNSDDDSEDDDDNSKSAETITLVKAKKKDLKYSTNQKEAFRLQIERNAQAYSRKYKQAFNKVLKTQEQTVLSNIQHLAPKSLRKGIADTLLNLSDEDQNFNQALTPVLSALTLESGQLAMEFSGGEAKAYVPSKALAAAIAASTKKMSQNFDAQTVDDLNDTLTEGLSNGETISQLSDRVSDVYDQASDYRSDRVARTEASSASNGATLDAYQQNPVVTAMTWYANPGACEYCEELDGTTVGLETSFVNQGDSVDVGDDSYQADYGDVDTPPLHPNCSCTIVPETEDAGSGDDTSAGDTSDDSDDDSENDS